MSLLFIQDKRDECDRLIKNISNTLSTILSGFLENISLETQDFNELMKLIRDNYTQLSPQFRSEFLISDCNICIKIRNVIYHQTPTTIDFLNRSIASLIKCQKAFGIQSPIVDLRILACKTCNTTITRTAQPTIRFRDMENNRERITRTYDVQSWVVANDNNQNASRDNTWYDGWVWTYTYCGECRRQNRLTHLGFRLDWAPEDRIDLTTHTIRYNLQRQAMVVINNNDGRVRDLTHVVSDGEVRRHRYALYEKQLRETPE
jgi:hypothetical protein